MEVKYKKIIIRNATIKDAGRLCTWWNDGNVMAHAGFPKGLGTTKEVVEKEIELGNDMEGRIHIIEIDSQPIGEMNYRNLGNKICEIGIKICDFSKQNKGLGKIILSLFIDSLFNKFGYEKIVLDTNLNNKRAQHVYEELGFKKVKVNINAFKDQLGNLQSSVDYELLENQFISYL